MKNYRNLLWAVFSVLLLLNLVGFSISDNEVFSWLRLLESVVLLSFLLRQHLLKDMYIIGAAFFFVILNVCVIHYEIPVFRRGYYLSGIFCYLFLVLHLWPELRKIRISLLEKIIFGTLFLLDGALVFYLKDIIREKFNDLFVEHLFLLYGCLSILLILAAVYYNNLYNNRSSLFFINAILFLVISDVTLFIAYYMELNLFYFPSALLYLFGITCLIKFSVIPKKEDLIPILKG
ncbi:hypothetical protein OQ279_13000 [Salinimicrobium sp. MT39]|uniref:YhhN-like protein n=1 Tax=Salinimicrobium profundisediminis TaxID=2994553 RepID=A0A9X3CYX9_9FLAO|nr:hypothetical protein [Salinimicrobium profundisediminis]MCX2839067.1 hypothetical protein [Salinimicrobium profundisediminis]